MANKQAVWKFTLLDDNNNYMITNSSTGVELCLLMKSEDGEDSPYRKRWAVGDYCGYPGGKQALLANKQAVWQLTKLIGNQYTMTNSSNGTRRCLVFGTNNVDQFPVLYNWGPGDFCGFPGGKTALLNNKQAVMTIQKLRPAWSIDTLVNRVVSPVTINVPFTEGVYNDLATDLSEAPTKAITLIEKGVIVFENQGQIKACNVHFWALSIRYNEQRWGYYYEAKGSIDVTLQADGSVELKAVSPSSQIVIGTGPPVCPTASADRPEVQS